MPFKIKMPLERPYDALCRQKKTILMVNKNNSLIDSSALTYFLNFSNDKILTNREKIDVPFLV